MFIAAGVSDAIDGFIAKNFNVRTTLGGYLDPLADKALLTSVYVTLGYEDHIEDWLVILIVFRDVLIIGGAILYQTLTQALTMQPLWISKINTVAQIMLAALLLGLLGYEIQERPWDGAGSHLVRRRLHGGLGIRLPVHLGRAVLPHRGRQMTRERQLRFWLIGWCCS